MLRNIIILLMFSLVMSLKTTLNLEGFGTQADFGYTSKIIVKDQIQLNQAVKNNFTLLIFYPTTINLTKQVLLQNVKNIIILGPIQFNQYGITIINSTNIILSNLRILNASIDGVLVSHSQNIVIDHLTIIDSGRSSIDKGKCIDLTQNSSNLTVSNSIIGYTAPFMSLIKNKGILVANFLQASVTNFSIHHNVFYCNYERSPQISTEGLFQMQNNIIFNWTQYGSRVRNNAYGNIQNNLYIGSRKDPLVIVSQGQQQTRDQDGILFIKNNVWKKSKDQMVYIDQDLRHQRYDTPFITPLSFKDTLQNAGFQGKPTYQTIIRTNINQFL